MDNESLQLYMQKIRNQLRDEQDKYVLAITGGKDQRQLKLIRDRIVTLQKQLENMTAGGGYTGL
jgi:DNA anti-recombination protein RmuC